ncbi:MAG: hypothetical protein AVDCRST_MAG59-39, partial [uncultured Thermomicrobiales bacterium]
VHCRPGAATRAGARLRGVGGGQGAALGRVRRRAASQPPPRADRRADSRRRSSPGDRVGLLVGPGAAGSGAVSVRRGGGAPDRVHRLDGMGRGASPARAVRLLRRRGRRGRPADDCPEPGAAGAGPDRMGCRVARRLAPVGAFGGVAGHDGGCRPMRRVAPGTPDGLAPYGHRLRIVPAAGRDRARRGV